MTFCRGSLSDMTRDTKYLYDNVSLVVTTPPNSYLCTRPTPMLPRETLVIQSQGPLFS